MAEDGDMAIASRVGPEVSQYTSTILAGNQIRINDVGVINDVDALKSMPCDDLDAASSWENCIMGSYGKKIVLSFKDTQPYDAA
jgi:hypothetical protein